VNKELTIIPEFCGIVAFFVTPILIIIAAWLIDEVTHEKHSA
jgi:hypothetical protein